MRMEDILEAKGRGVNTIYVQSTLRTALEEMIGAKVGSLVAVDKDFRPVGIISERDIIRVVHEKGQKDWGGLSVGEGMTRNIIVGVPNDDVEYIMALMTQNRIRHVPIVHKGKLEGIISIGDIVKSQLQNAKAENRYLEEYIAGKYPG